MSQILSEPGNREWEEPVSEDMAGSGGDHLSNINNRTQNEETTQRPQTAETNENDETTKTLQRHGDEIGRN
jgi:hypothetical protein